MKKKNKVDIKRVTIVILFSILMILWLFKGPIKTFFKEKKKKGTATLYIENVFEKLDTISA